MVTDYVTFNHCFGCNYHIRRWKDGTTCTIRAPVYIYFHLGPNGDLGMTTQFMLVIKDQFSNIIRTHASRKSGESIALKNTILSKR